MKISILSNYTFASSLPDDTLALHQYGSESMTAVLASELAKTNEVDFYAPVGSSRIGNFHPLRRTDGKYLGSDLLQDISLDGMKTEDLLSTDFLIDCSPWANNIEELALYNDFRKYLVYRLGYKDYDHPNLSPQLRHFITHCQHFANLYKEAGYDAQVAHFGLTDFWSPSPDDIDAYINLINQKYGLKPKQYYLYPHRYNKEKGSFDVIRLAKDFPDRVFVFSSAAVLPDHVAALQELQRIATPNCKFVQFPSTPDREYYRRELYRNAICTLSPFHNMNGYADTGGILSMESLKCGTPVICTRSPGSEEILGHQEDKGVFFIDGYESLKLLVRYAPFMGLIPEPWKWTPDLYVKEYMSAIENIIN